MEHPKFSKANGNNFSKALRQRVNQYFKDNNLSKHANGVMITKTVIMLILFFAPLILLGTGLITTPLLLFAAYLTSGLGMAGIGMGIMHDAIHGSYSKNKAVNKVLGSTMNLIGANAYVWKIQHNMLHHTYTNIEGADDDIATPFFLRFSPHDSMHWLHRFQHIYGWFFYGLSTIMWITTKDFMNLKHFWKAGLIKSRKEYTKELVRIAGWKIIYYSYALALPLIMVPLSPLLIIAAFLSMHFITGILITMVFQTAHVMPNTEYPLPDENGLIGNNWTIHQMVTTTNYAPNNNLLFWLVGGLNFQVEHHLLPNVCHVHYKKLAPIVAETAKEYGIPYNSKPTFRAALKEHVKMLKTLGTMKPA